MQNRTLKLSNSFINKLVNLPETGMGYQTVKVILKNGKTLHRHKVLNAELLMLEENENITIKDIEKIEIE
jgi:small nuclear ribonucleoprotein (snRNP)-like protein